MVVSSTQDSDHAPDSFISFIHLTNTDIVPYTGPGVSSAFMSCHSGIPCLFLSVAYLLVNKYLLNA